MQVHRDIDHLPVFKNAVVTIGTFDGVHLGHRKILYQLKQEAAIIAGETVIVTFHPHPRKVVHNATHQVRLITTIEERIDLLSAIGIDHLVVVPFTEAFSELSPEEYVENFLTLKFHPHTVIIGYDHRFGKGRKGDYKLLEDYRNKGYFELKEIPQHVIKDSTVSSTLIRQSITEGNISLANSLLGYEFFFEGRVVRGDQRGRTIGFPTANLRVEDEEKIIPGNGVYGVDVAFNGQDRFKGMMNIGVRPTVDGSTKTIEVNIFDFDKDIYEKRLRVYVKKFLRGEQKFESLDALKAQLYKDRHDSLSL
jgi:riboflavin kinase/FMN adenylyltransferase